MHAASFEANVPNAPKRHIFASIKKKKKKEEAPSLIDQIPTGVADQHLLNAPRSFEAHVSYAIIPNTGSRGVNDI